MRVMYSILSLLYREGVNSKLVSLTQKEIQKCLEDEGEKYCDRTMYLKCTELLKNGFIKEGMKNKNARTFYIGADGIEWLSEMQKSEVEENGK